jgi:hypothetical protein
LLYLEPQKMKENLSHIKALILALLFTLQIFEGKAQSFDIGGFGGLGFSRGDVGKTMRISSKDLSFGGFLRYNFRNKRYAFRTHLIIGSISNADSLSNLDYKKERNLSFKTNIQEFGAILEFNFKDYESGTLDWMTPYIFSGFVIYRFNPTAELNGNTYDLQPLRTEGQGTSSNSETPYKLIKFGIPLGMGYKISIGKFAAVSFEGGLRISFSDYLDDASGVYADPNVLRNEVGPISAAFADRSISTGDKTNFQRADRYTNDIYGFIGFTVVLHLDFKKKDNCYFQE